MEGSRVYDSTGNTREAQQLRGRVFQEAFCTSERIYVKTGVGFDSGNFKHQTLQQHILTFATQIPRTEISKFIIGRIWCHLRILISK